MFTDSDRVVNVDDDSDAPPMEESHEATASEDDANATAMAANRAKVANETAVQQGLALLAQEWLSKAGVAAAWRLKVPSEEGSPLEVLVRIWNAMRGSERRPSLTSKQISLIPPNDQLHAFFLALFESPLTWDPASFPAILREHRVEEEEHSPMNRARYFVHRLGFQGQEELNALLTDQVAVEVPHYAGLIEVLQSYANGLECGAFCLSFKRFTVANAAVGLDLYDSESTKLAFSQGDFLQAVLRLFKGKVEIYEVLPLSFEIGTGGLDSVKQSRRDPRTTLFESLLYDSMGFICLNTMATPTCIELVPSPEFLRIQEALRNRRSAPHKPFSWQTASSSSTRE